MTSISSLIDGSLEDKPQTAKAKTRNKKRDYTLVGLGIALLLVVGAAAYGSQFFSGYITTSTSIEGSTTRTTTVGGVTTVTNLSTQTDQNTTIVQPAVLLYTTTVTITGTATVNSTTTVYTTDTTIVNSTTTTITCTASWPSC